MYSSTFKMLLLCLAILFVSLALMSCTPEKEDKPGYKVVTYDYPYLMPQDIAPVEPKPMTSEANEAIKEKLSHCMDKVYAERERQRKENLERYWKEDMLRKYGKEEIEEDIEYLTRFLFGECGGSGWTFKSACAWAIVNGLGGSGPGHFKDVVVPRVSKKTGDTSYSYYISSYINHYWVTEYDKNGNIKWHWYNKEATIKKYHIAEKETNPSKWNDCNAVATDVYWRWIRELEGETDVGRTLPKGYTHFWNDDYGFYFPKDWGTRKKHTTDYKLDYANSPYNS